MHVKDKHFSFKPKGQIRRKESYNPDKPDESFRRRKMSPRTTVVAFKDNENLKF
jgi:hypothetical protein